MKTTLAVEYEVRFPSVAVDEVSMRLAESGAALIIPRTLMKRIIFEHPKLDKQDSWLRLRDEGTRTTLSYKVADLSKDLAIDSVREIEIVVSDFDATAQLLRALGYVPVRYQENYREEYEADGIKFDLDTWPGLPTFLEIEGPDEESVRLAVKCLGLDFEQATYGSVDETYRQQLGIDILQMERLVFTGELHAADKN